MLYLGRCNRYRTQNERESKMVLEKNCQIHIIIFLNWCSSVLYKQLINRTWFITISPLKNKRKDSEKKNQSPRKVSMLAGFCLIRQCLNSWIALEITMKKKDKHLDTPLVSLNPGEEILLGFGCKVSKFKVVNQPGIIRYLYCLIPPHVNKNQFIYDIHILSWL